MKGIAKLLSDSTEPCFNWLRGQYIQNQIPLQSRQRDTAIWKILSTFIEPTMQMSKVIIGDGRTTAFWKDYWTNNGRLYLCFPTLFTFAINQNCTVSSQSVDNNWVIELHPVLSQQAATEHQALLQLLSEQHLTQGTLDRRVLASTMTDVTTSGIYKILSTHGLKWKAADFTWLKSILHRYRIFLWLAFKGKLNTKDNMTVKKWTINPHCDICPALETIDHIILRCKAADYLWTKIGLSSEATSSKDMLEFVEKVSAHSVSHHNVWPICFAACVHTLWTMRNKRIFQNTESGNTTMQRQIREYIDLWSYRSKPEQQDSLSQWCQLFM